MQTSARHVLWMMLAMAVAAASAAHAQTTYTPTQVAADAGSVTAIKHWQIQDSAKAQQGGADISGTGFSTKGWYPVSGRATVMAGLLENGTFKNDVFYSDNLRAVQVPDASGNLFVTPWWYRAVFTLPKNLAGRHTRLRTNGIVASADVWVNGHQVADHAEVAGAYPVHELDVTRWVHPGANALAMQVHPADPRKSLSIGWVDWNPTPPDNNMGPWRGVDIVQTGPVALSFPHVLSTLSLPDLTHAALTVKVTAKNLDTVAHDATISGTAAGVSMQQTVHLAPGQTQVVSFSPTTTPGLALDHPKIWWPVGMGDHPLYQLELTAAVDGSPSDRASTTFGIRSVSSSLTKQDYRQFFINGKPLLIRGGGWAPDMFLRDDPARMEAEFSYVLNLGLNTIRSEGKLENQRFYDLADRNGILVLAGWECCDKWESAAKTGGSAVGCGRPEGSGRLHGQRSAPASQPSFGDRLLHRQRQCATAAHRKDVRRYAARRGLVVADHLGRCRPADRRNRPFRHEDGRPVRLDTTRLLVRRQAGRRVRLRFGGQCGRRYPAAGRPEAHAVAAGAGSAVEIPGGAAIPRLRGLVDLRCADAVRQGAGRSLRRTHQPCRLCRQGPARQLRQRPRAVRGVQCAHGCRQARDRCHLLDAQQRVAVAALASVRLLHESRRRVLRRQESQRARCTSSIHTTRTASCW